MYRNLSCFCSRGLYECLNPKCYTPLPVSRNISLVANTSEYQDDYFAMCSKRTPKSNICDDMSSDDDLPLSYLASSNKEDISFTNLQEARYKSIYKSVYGSSDDSDNENNSAEPLPSVSGQSNNLPKIGDYLLVKVHSAKGKLYHTYACIAQSDIEDDGEIKVTFLKCVKGGKLFVLDEKDVSYVAYDDIIQKLPNPEVQRKRGVDYFKFSTDINVFEK